MARRNPGQYIRRRYADGSIGPAASSFKKGEEWTGNPNGRGEDLRPLPDEVRTKILKGVKLGLSYDRIARSVGIPPMTMVKWLKKAQRKAVAFYAEWERTGIIPLAEVKDGVDLDNPDAAPTVEAGMLEWWIQFWVDLKEAEAAGEQQLLEVVVDAAVGNHVVREVKRKTVSGVVIEESEIEREVKPSYKAALRIMELRWPQKYMKKKIDEVNGSNLKSLAAKEGISVEVLQLAAVLNKLPKADLEAISSSIRDSMAGNEDLLRLSNSNAQGEEMFIES